MLAKALGTKPSKKRPRKASAPPVSKLPNVPPLDATAPQSHSSSKQLKYDGMQLWELQRKVRLVREEINELETEKEAVHDGAIPVDLWLTPRPSHRNASRLKWTDGYKSMLRCNARRDWTGDVEVRLEKLRSTMGRLTTKIKGISGARLPPLHFRLLRNAAVDVSDIREIKKAAQPFGGDPNEQIVNGWSPLHIAVQKLQKDVVDVLINIPGVNVELKDDAEYTPLHYACMLNSFPIAKALVDAGADLTERNREEHTPLDVGEAMGHYDLVEDLVEAMSVPEEAQLHARRFYKQLFAGKPDHYHYREKFFERGRLLAYVLLFKPKTFSRKKGKYVLREELFDEEILGSKAFKTKKAHKWRPKVEAWNYLDPDSAEVELVSNAIFGGKVVPEEIVIRLAAGRVLWEQWRDEHASELREEEERKTQYAADALRAKKLMEARAKKKKLEEEEERRRLAEDAKKGPPIDPNAGVTISAQAVVFGTDDEAAVEYTVVLDTEPHGSVLVKFSVKCTDQGGKCQLKTTPKLITFAPENWDEKQTIAVEAKDDDALVRLKREVASGRGDHVVEHSIQFTTDRSYKSKDLRWSPSASLAVKVTV